MATIKSQIMECQNQLKRYPPVSPLNSVWYRFKIETLRQRLRKRLPPRHPILLEVGKDFNIKIKTYSKEPKYVRYKMLTLDRKSLRIPIKRLKEIIKRLQDRYPKKNYYLERAKAVYEGKVKIFWIIGRKEEKRKGIPIYYSSSLAKLFVPKSYVDRKYRLVGVVLLYRLRDLGIRYSLRYLR